MRRAVIAAALAVALMAAALPANAAVHEITGAPCNGTAFGVEAPGQDGVTPVPAGEFELPSGLAALIATGVIASFDFSVPGEVTVTFDLSKPSSKFVTAGFDLTIPDGFSPGVDLILSPLPIPDSTFPAFANCKILNP